MVIGDPLNEGQQQQQAGDQPVQQQFEQIQFGPEDLLLMQNGQNGSGPTSTNVCVDNFPGAFNFSVNFTTLHNNKSKHWDVSTYRYRKKWHNRPENIKKSRPKNFVKSSKSISRFF